MAHRTLRTLFYIVLYTYTRARTHTGLPTMRRSVLSVLTVELLSAIYLIAEYSRRTLAAVNRPAGHSNETHRDVPCSHHAMKSPRHTDTDLTRRDTAAREPGTPQGTQATRRNPSGRQQIRLGPDTTPGSLGPSATKNEMTPSGTPDTPNSFYM